MCAGSEGGPGSWDVSKEDGQIDLVGFGMVISEEQERVGGRPELGFELGIFRALFEGGEL